MENQLHECKFCNQKTLMHVDDEGSFGGMGVSWDHYICKVCLSEKDVISRGNEEKVTWTNRNKYIVRSETEARNFYRSLVS